VRRGRWPHGAWWTLGGAALGTLSRRRVRRVPLALAALIAQEIRDLYTWTLGAVHTPAAFLAVAGHVLPYDVTGVIASFLFGIAFAPELAQVLTRVRVRMNVTWAQAPTASPPSATDRDAAKFPRGAREVPVRSSCSGLERATDGE
jgi:hypothetical protein